MARRYQAGLLLITVPVAVFFIPVAVINRDWPMLGWSVSAAIAIPCWLLAFEAPSTCGFTTQRGTPCPNYTTGILFGCTNASGHLWGKMFARFGWHRGALPTRKGSQATSADPGSLSNNAVPAEPVLVRVEESRGSKVAVWLAVISTICGLTSAATDIAGALR